MPEPHPSPTLSDEALEPQTRRLGFKAVLALLLVSVLLMGGCILGLWTLRRDGLARENENLLRLALTLSEHTALAFREIDIVLRETRPYLTPEAMARADDSLHRLLGEKYRDLRQGQALLAFGPDGGMLGHSREYPTPKVNIADRDYFVAQKSGGDALFISAPMRNRVNRRWMISLSRRLSSPDGGFAGVVMAAVEVEYFSRLFALLNLPADAQLELRRADGVLLAAYPFDEARLGSVTQVRADGEQVLTAAAEVPSLPLGIRLTLPRTVALRPWRLHMAAAGVGMLAVLAFVAALTATRLAHVRQLRQRTLLLQRSEAALRASETRYRTIVETANEGICIIDASQRLTYVNHVLAEMLGQSEAEMVGRQVENYLFEEDLHLLEQEQARRKQNRRGSYERRLRGKNGQVVWASISSTPLMDESGAFQGSFAMLTDITRRKEEEKFREGIDGILRHDLRSPLAAMSYIPKMLLEPGTLTQQQRMLVGELGRYVKRMLRMVEAYLGLSRIEKEGYRPTVQPVDLAALMREVEVELKTVQEAAGVWLAVLLNGRPLAPEDTVPLQAEETLCQTMLINLVKNALEASPPGASVEVALEDQGEALDIAIRNQGAVPEAIRDRFFQKYVTSGKRHGTGLGAYSARLIAEAHGGSVELDASEPGATTLRVRLPRDAQGPLDGGAA